jgi:UDP-N-acetylglucosamine--N-acetylmuramyl-(pentapeptide) pyrophosphoryl-undecaprenol N-acetylglucosamine transferase
MWLRVGPCSVSKTILVMAGGTGGHIFPALAVAEVLRRHDWRVVWLGSRAGMEMRVIPEHGYQIEAIRFGGVRGKGLVRLAMLPLNLLIAFWQSAGVIFRVRPDVVLGMGGYVSFPGAMMAALFLRPLIIHEQNTIAGLSNKVLAMLADRVLEAFPGALSRATCTGNPVRQSVIDIDDPKQRFSSRSGRLRVLVMGGSLGSTALNETVPGAIALLPQETRPDVTHQSGRQHLPALENAYRDAGVDANTVAFVDDIGSAYAQADLVVCRAGAITIAELAVAGVPSVLVPFPFAVDDHQTVNARFLADSEAAVLIQQKDLTPRRLADVLLNFTRERLALMAGRARALGKPNAASDVANNCMAMAG